MRFLAVTLLGTVGLPFWVGAAEWYPPTATAQEQLALDELAGKIEGTLVYTRPPRSQEGEVVWMIDRMRLGDWRAETIAEGSCARWSPDGTRVAVFRPDDGEPGDGAHGAIWIMRADGTGQKPVVEQTISRGIRGACPLDFHPNNREIVYIREDGGVSAVDVRTARERDLRLPGFFQEEVQLTGDGKRLVGRWKGRGDWAMNRRMVVVNLDSKVVRVYGAGCCAAISPDGNWMTVNHDGHYSMSVCHRDIRHRVKLKARRVIEPQHGWHNWHWSNHNDYLAIKSEVYRKIRRDYQGPPDAFVVQFSEKHGTRVTFRQEADWPDLFVSRDRRSGKPRSRRGFSRVTKKQVEAKPYDIARVFRTRGETEKDPGRPARIPRIRVEARLTQTTSFGAEEALRHGRCLVEYVYRVTKVLEGSVTDETIIVLHWAARGRNWVPWIGTLKVGRTYRMRLEPWHLHPELKSIARRLAVLPDGIEPPRYLHVRLR